MDRTVDPCEDFYQFTCGSFLNTKRIKEDETKINEFSILRDKLSFMLAGKLLYFNIQLSNNINIYIIAYSLFKIYYQSR